MSPRASRGRADAGTARSTDDAAGSAPLEARYRRWLRVLPTPYRAAREQEMVDTFLDRAYGDDPGNADLTAKFGGVGAGEAASVLALAWRLRWADPCGPARFRVRAAALPLATLSALTVLAVGAAVSLLGRLWLLLIPPGDLAISPLDLAFGTAPGWWPLLDAWSFALWIPALALALVGSRRAAALLAAVAAAVTLADALRGPGTWPAAAAAWAAIVVQWSVVVSLAAVGAAGAAGRRDPIRRRSYLAVALAGLVGYQVITVVALLRPPAAVLYPLAIVFFGGAGATTGLWFVATVIAATTLAIRAARGARPAAATLLALAAFAAATTLLLLSGVPTAWQMYAEGEGPWGALLLAMAIECAMAAAITVTAGILAARRIRRLPPVSYFPGGG